MLVMWLKWNTGWYMTLSLFPHLSSCTPQAYRWWWTPFWSPCYPSFTSHCWFFSWLLFTPLWDWSCSSVKCTRPATTLAQVQYQLQQEVSQMNAPVWKLDWYNNCHVIQSRIHILYVDINNILVSLLKVPYYAKFILCSPHNYWLKAIVETPPPPTSIFMQVHPLGISPKLNVSEGVVWICVKSWWTEKLIYQPHLKRAPGLPLPVKISLPPNVAN